MILEALGVLLIIAGLLVLLWPGKEEERHEEAAGKGREDRLYGRSDEGADEEADEGLESNRAVKEETRVKGGAVVMIGPIPVIIGSDPRTALLVATIALAIMILWIVADKGM